MSGMLGDAGRDVSEPGLRIRSIDWASMKRIERRTTGRPTAKAVAPAAFKRMFLARPV